MRRPATVVLAGMGVVLGLSAACGQTGTSKGVESSTPQHAASTATTQPPGNACDRQLITKDDLAGILKAPISNTKSLAPDGDSQTCVFETAAFTSITVTLRPGLGNVTVGTWASGRMPSATEPVTGVGDRAVWVPDLKELVATRNDVLCDIGVGGPPGSSESIVVVKQRLGDACNRIFAKQ